MGYQKKHSFLFEYVDFLAVLWEEAWASHFSTKRSTVFHCKKIEFDLPDAPYAFF